MGRILALPKADRNDKPIILPCVDSPQGQLVSLQRMLRIATWHIGAADACGSVGRWRIVLPLRLARMPARRSLAIERLRVIERDFFQRFDRFENPGVRFPLEQVKRLVADGDSLPSDEAVPVVVLDRPERSAIDECLVPFGSAEIRLSPRRGGSLRGLFRHARGASSTSILNGRAAFPSGRDD